MGSVINLNRDTKYSDEFRGYDIPEQTQGALSRYVNHRLQPGGFLTAVLCNDLFSAVGRADDENIVALVQICKWLYNEAPSNCWGSIEKFESWMSQT